MNTAGLIADNHVVNETFCSACGKKILAGATFCRFCGQSASPTTQMPTAQLPPTPKSWASSHPVLTVLVTEAVLFLSLILYAAVFGTSFIVGVAAVIIVAGFVAVDAHKRGMNSGAWFAGMLLMACVALPMYFIQRKPKGSSPLQETTYPPTLKEPMDKTTLCLIIGAAFVLLVLVAYVLGSRQTPTFEGNTPPPVRVTDTKQQIAPQTATTEAQQLKTTPAEDADFMKDEVSEIEAGSFDQDGNAIDPNCKNLPGGCIPALPAIFVSDTMESLHRQAVRKYGIAKRDGNHEDACVASNTVAEDFMEATDEMRYKEWKTIARVECQAAGIALAK